MLASIKPLLRINKDQPILLMSDFNMEFYVEFLFFFAYLFTFLFI